MHSRKGVRQGDPLSMIKYGIYILPLTKNLKRDIPDVNQTWYADDARDLGTFARIETYFNSLTLQNPGRVYYPEPSKSILILHRENIKAGKEFGKSHKFKVCTGACYLGGYIRDDNSKINWMRERTMTWEKNIRTIRETAGEYTQESYAAVVRAIQTE